MDAPPPDPGTPLPSDVAALQAMVRELLADNARLRAEVADLRGKLDAALKHRFGRRSERGRTSRRPPEPDADPDPAPAAGGHGRGPLPDHLPRRTVEHDLTAAEKACPCCGRERACIGTQAAEQLDYDPAAYFVLRTVRRVYACRRCDPSAVPAEQRLTTAGPPQVGPVPKGLCGPGLLAFVATAKFADHLPLHRLAGMIGRSGVAVAPSTLGGWVAAAADLLAPLRGLMRRRVLSSRVVHTDDTPVSFREPGRDRTRRGHLWVYLGDAAHPCAVFDFTPGYSRDGPSTFLAGYAGYVQADALKQYADVYAAGAAHVCCWAHARRKFVAAADAGEKRADEPLGLIRRLYHVERSLPGLGSSPDAEAVRAARRQAEAVPVLAELRGCLVRHRPGVLPRSPLGQAITYAVTNWDALHRYTAAGFLTIDNNRSERVLRQVAVGRNNWGVAGSAAGGRTAAMLYSVVATCRQFGLDPFAYLRAALPALFELGDQASDADLAPWLPDVWCTRSAPAAALAG
ncbi:IS66 family transposase [bacterium]|nr:IS66 family transposase [bacterium]